MDSLSQKRCPSCPEGQEWHPATPEFFSRRKTSKDGLDHRCKQCASKTAKVSRAKPEVRARMQDRRRLLEVRQKGRDREKSYRSTPEGHARHIARMKAYRARPEVQAHTREYNNNSEVRERIRPFQQAYRHSDKGQNARKSYNQSPEGRVHSLAAYHKRRAIKHSASGTYTPKEIKEQYQRQKRACYYCQQKVEWGKHHVDHVVPLSRGGSNDISNLVIACPTCNLRKNNRMPHEWIDGGKLL